MPQQRSDLEWLKGLAKGIREGLYQEESVRQEIMKHIFYAIDEGKTTRQALGLEMPQHICWLQRLVKILKRRVKREYDLKAAKKIQVHILAAVAANETSFVELGLRSKKHLDQLVQSCRHYRLPESIWVDWENFFPQHSSNVPA